MLSNLARQLLYAHSRTRRSAAALVLELLRLRFGRGRIGFSEYFDFRLYERGLSFAEKRAFGGYRVQHDLEDLLVDDYSRILSLDKLLFYSIMSAHGYPIPRQHALYCASKRSSPVPVLSDEHKLRTFLTECRAYPLYFKPCFGSYGRGNVSITGFDNDHVTRSGDARIGLREFAQSLTDKAGFGWLIQDALTPHQKIRDRCGDRISGLRLHVFLSNDGPKILRAIWKVNVGTKDTDNFEHGASGNLLAAVSVSDGSVMRVVSGIGPSQRQDVNHPVTGLPLKGFSLPHWEATAAIVCKAATAFPGFLCQGWDVAICEIGPVLLEVNAFGDIDLSQHSHRRGFLDDEFLALLDGLNLRHLLFGASCPQKKNRNNDRSGKRKSHWTW